MTRSSWITLIAGFAVLILVMGVLALASGGGSGSGDNVQPDTEETAVSATDDSNASDTSATVDNPDTMYPQSGISEGTANNIDYEASDLYNKGT